MLSTFLMAGNLVGCGGGAPVSLEWVSESVTRWQNALWTNLHREPLALTFPHPSKGVLVGLIGHPAHHVWHAHACWYVGVIMELAFGER